MPAAEEHYKAAEAFEAALQAAAEDHVRRSLTRAVSGTWDAMLMSFLCNVLLDETHPAHALQ